MNCAEISKLIGYTCYPLNDDDTVALIETPFKFADGDDIPVYVEFGAGFVRFFDDGEVFDHFAGLGIFLDNDHDTEFLSVIAESSGTTFTGACEIEIRAEPEQTQAAFASYMAAMFASISWEKAWDAKLSGELPLSVMK